MQISIKPLKIYSDLTDKKPPTSMTGGISKHHLSQLGTIKLPEMMPTHSHENIGSNIIKLPHLPSG